MPYGLRPGSQLADPEKSDNDKMLDALSRVLTEQLMAEQPQVPQAPAFHGLPGVKAAAAAMNPQLAPQIIQQQMAPDVARYQTQQQEFERAMSQRQQAIQAATQLGSREISGQYGLARPNRALRPIPERGERQMPDGTYHNIVTYRDPQTLEVLHETDWGQRRTGYTYMMDNEGNIIEFPSSGAPRQMSGQAVEGTTAGRPTGRLGAQPVEPGGRVAAARGTVLTIDTIKDVWKQAQGLPPYAPQADRPAIIEGAIDWGLQKFPGTTQTLIPERDYQRQATFKAGVDNAVLKYVNSLSGKQYTLQELEKFRALFPNIQDTEAVVNSKLQQLKDSVLRDIAEWERQFPQTQRGAAQAAPVDLDSEFDAWRKNNAPNR